MYSCYNPGARRVSYSSNYQNVTEEKKILKCEILPYSNHTDSIRLYFLLQSNQLNYQKNAGTGRLEASLRFYYRLMRDENGKYVTCDSSTVFYKDVRNGKVPSEIMGFIQMSGKRGFAYKIKLIVSELNSRGRCEKEFFFSLVSPNSPYLFLNHSAGNAPSFQPKALGDSIRVKSNALTGQVVRVRYYNRNFGTAPPPFATGKPLVFAYRADSVFNCLVLANGNISFLSKGNGFYHIQLDSHMRDGYTIYCFPSGYPAIKTGKQMIEPLLFLCSREEYEQMAIQVDKHKAAEEFWVTRSTSRERAREVIRQFYQRVEESNREYTSYIEGWRTDRGMIHIIFGKPGFTQVTESGETWTYRTGMNAESLHFTFRKADNPFSNNDYILDRSMVYKPVWYNAVENWRMGKVFKLNQF
jgi:GWxTD domain-containing protein